VEPGDGARQPELLPPTCDKTGVYDKDAEELVWSQRSSPVGADGESVVYLIGWYSLIGYICIIYVMSVCKCVIQTTPLRLLDTPTCQTVSKDQNS